MHSASLDEEDSHIASINIIPLVDVVLVLLIIFMVTTVFTRESAMDLELPKGSRADHSVQPPAEITVSVDEKSSIYVNGQPTPLTSLFAKVSSLRNRGRKTIIVLRGDRRVLYGTLMPVLDEISRTGVNITLALQSSTAK